MKRPPEARVARRRRQRVAVAPSAGGAVALGASSTEWLTSADELALPAPARGGAPELVAASAAALAILSLCLAALCAWWGWGLEGAAWALCAVLSTLLARFADPLR